MRPVILDMTQLLDQLENDPADVGVARDGERMALGAVELCHIDLQLPADQTGHQCFVTGRQIANAELLVGAVVGEHWRLSSHVHLRSWWVGLKAAFVVGLEVGGEVFN